MKKKVDHLSRLEADACILTKQDVTEKFLDKYLLIIEHAQMLQQASFPWYAYFTNYLVSGLLVSDLSYQQKKRFLHDVRSYQ